MDVIELGPAAIVGHSMGSRIAQRHALDHPERTLGLVLVGSFTTMRGNAGVRGLREAIPAMDPIEGQFALEFQQSTLAQPVSQAFLETVVPESLKAPARVWRAALDGLIDAEFAEELGRIEAPTLIMWGDALLTTIAGSELVVYAGAGHAPHWEEPARFAADLVAFIEKL